MVIFLKENDRRYRFLFFSILRSDRAFGAICCLRMPRQGEMMIMMVIDGAKRFASTSMMTELVFLILTCTKKEVCPRSGLRPHRTHRKRKKDGVSSSKSIPRIGHRRNSRFRSGHSSLLHSLLLPAWCQPFLPNKCCRRRWPSVGCSDWGESVSTKERQNGSFFDGVWRVLERRKRVTGNRPVDHSRSLAYLLRSHNIRFE